MVMVVTAGGGLGILLAMTGTYDIGPADIDPMIRFDAGKPEVGGG